MSNLYIVSNSKKIGILKRNNLLSDDKYITLEDFISRVTYKSDVRTLEYIAKKMDLNLENSKKILKSLIINKGINNKTDKLIELKEDLIKNGLLNDDKLFKSSIKDMDIISLYDDVDMYSKSILDQYNVKYEEIIGNREFNYTHFNNAFDEVVYAFESIISLIRSGININDIKLMVTLDDYKKIINKVSYFYNIPVIKEYSILSNEGVNNFLNNSIINIEDSKIHNKVINICNKYVAVMDEGIRNGLIQDEIRESKLTKKETNSLEYVDMFNDDYEGKYIFILGFNSDFIKLNKDTDYLSDKEKEELGLETSYMINNRVKTNFINLLNKLDNVYISYSDTYLKEEYEPNSLISELNMKKLDTNLDVISSIKYGEFKLASMLDDYYKYKIEDINLDSFNNTFKIPYLDYDNKYTKVDINLNNFNLSYTSINDFYNCPFKYYLKYVLKLSDFEDTLATKLGNYAHYILSKSFEANFDFDKYSNKFISSNNLSNKELFYLNKIDQNIKEVINFNKEFNLNTKLNNYVLEKKLEFKKSDVTVKGFIDKIMYADNKVAVIDYKTGKASVDLNNVEYGLNLQLLFYFYLISKSEFKDPMFVGMYLQRVINDTPKLDKDIDEQIRDDLKLVGYTNSNYVDIMDYTYENSEFIKGLKLTTKGELYKNSKVLTSDEINHYIDIVDQHVDNAIENIKSNNFPIKPISINGSLKGCEYCPYIDICNRTSEDINNVGGINEVDE